MGVTGHVRLGAFGQSYASLSMKFGINQLALYALILFSLAQGTVFIHESRISHATFFNFTNQPTS